MTCVMYFFLEARRKFFIRYRLARLAAAVLARRGRSAPGWEDVELMRARVWARVCAELSGGPGPCCCCCGAAAGVSIKHTVFKHWTR